MNVNKPKLSPAIAFAVAALAVSGLDCNGDEVPEVEQSADDITADSHSKVQSALTDLPVALPDPQPLDGKEFPIHERGDVVGVLDDGTRLELVKKGEVSIIRAFLDNRRAKFENLSDEQWGMVYAATSFKGLQRLTEIFIEQGMEDIRNGDSDGDYISVLIEGQIDECPEFRYRRSMMVVPELLSVKGSECVWDEWDPQCASVVGKSFAASTLVKWDAFLDPATGDFSEYPVVFSPAGVKFATPIPKEWIATQASCPDPNGVVSQWTIVDGEIVPVLSE
ncbi:MAG: hypothetical protein ABII07_02190 [Patescibacteria group bacterium]|nr:hypothetical protein [Patescibacteria group bacterium]